MSFKTLYLYPQNFACADSVVEESFMIQNMPMCNRYPIPTIQDCIA